MELDARLKSPFTAVISGPTGSGKTHLLINLINQAQEVTDSPPVEIIYCYGVWQSIFKKIGDKVRFVEGMIDVKNDVANDGKNRWLIIDDLMQETSGKDDTNSLYTKYSHHMNISVFFIVQNLFVKANRTISLNSHYFFLFKNPRDGTTVRNLANQAFPGKTAYVMEAFKDATFKPYSYLLIDLRQETDDRMRLIASYASTTSPMAVYVDKSV